MNPNFKQLSEEYKKNEKAKQERIKQLLEIPEFELVMTELHYIEEQFKKNNIIEGCIRLHDLNWLLDKWRHKKAVDEMLKNEVKP